MLGTRRVKRQSGFTLIELLIVVSLTIIVVGVTGDIVVTLVRSYNKTQITTEIEQNANFAMTKIEKELRNAFEVTNISADTITFRRERAAGAGIETITYSFVEDTSGPPGTFYLGRSIDGGAVIPVTNSSFPAGVTLDTGISSFADATGTTGPRVIKVTLSMRQIGNPAVQFTQATTLENTVIVRGSY